MTSLVTGASGLVGFRLVEALAGAKGEVWALSRRAPDGTPAGAGVRVVEADVLDAEAVRRAVAEARPQAVYHLAAQSLPGASWKDPAGTFRVNVDGTLNVLEAVRASGPGSVVVVAGSSGGYAPRADGAPIREDGALEPSSPYAASKLAAEQLAALYGRRYGLKIVRARPFFLVGPRKRGDVCSDFARGIVAIERGKARDLPVGDLGVVRDFLDARDGASALLALAERGRPGEAYNVCSGRGVRVGELLDVFKSLARAPVRSRTDPALRRPIDEPVKIGDPAKLRALGWSPSFALERTLGEILEYWRAEDARVSAA